MMVVLNLAISADPDEMLPYAALYLGLHSLKKYLFRGFQYTKGSGSSLFVKVLV